MADSGLQAPRSGPEMLAGAAIPFRFEVTWRSLTQPLGPSSATAAIAKPARRVPVRDSEAKEWEMVLPRMKRRVGLAAAVGEVRDVPLPAPSFGVAAEGGSLAGLMVRAGIPLVIVIGIGWAYWGGQRAAPESEKAGLIFERS